MRRIKGIKSDCNTFYEPTYLAACGEVVDYVIMDDKVVYLLTIYSKKDDDKVLSNKEIVELIAKYCL